MAICMVCKANSDVGGATYSVDSNTLRLCKDCYGKVEVHILVVCSSCGFYWVSTDELSEKTKEGIPVIRVTNTCIKCDYKESIKALPAP